MTIVLKDRLTHDILQIIESSNVPLQTEEIVKQLQKNKPVVTRTKVIYRLQNLRAENLVGSRILDVGKGVWIWWNMSFQKSLKQSPADDVNAWPEEVEALENIQSGKTRMVTQSADETLAELRKLENEP
jgi:hypothetical protein